MDISHWRKEIDVIETQLINALNTRAEHAIQIGLIKRDEGLEVYDEARENEILERVAQKNQGPLSDDAIQAIFKQIIHETRSLESEHHAQDKV